MRVRASEFLRPWGVGSEPEAMGFMTATRNPCATNARVRAAEITVLPTPVSVPVMKRDWCFMGWGAECRLQRALAGDAVDTGSRPRGRSPDPCRLSSAVPGSRSPRQGPLQATLRSCQEIHFLRRMLEGGILTSPACADVTGFPALPQAA